MAASTSTGGILGGLIYWVLASTVVRQGKVSLGFTSHLRRAAALYLDAVLGLMHVFKWYRDSDFWMYGGIVIWITAAALGGVVADWLVIVSSNKTERK